MTRLVDGAQGRYFGSNEYLKGITTLNFNGLLVTQHDIVIADRPFDDSFIPRPLTQSDAEKPFVHLGLQSMTSRNIVATFLTVHALELYSHATPKIDSEYVERLKTNLSAFPEEIACMGNIVLATCAQLGVPGLGLQYAGRLSSFLPDNAVEQFMPQLAA